MKFTIRFRQMNHSSRIFDLVDSETRKLHSQYGQIISCYIVVEKPHKRHRKGNQVRALLKLSFPRKKFVFSKLGAGKSEHENALAAIASAFDAAEYAINEYIRKQRTKNARYRKPQFGLFPFAVPKFGCT